MKLLHAALALLVLLLVSPNTAVASTPKTNIGFPMLDAGETLSIQYPHFLYVLHSDQPDGSTPDSATTLTITWKWHGNDMKLEANQQPGEGDDAFASRFLKKVKAVQLLFPPDHHEQVWVPAPLRLVA